MKRALLLMDKICPVVQFYLGVRNKKKKAAGFETMISTSGFIKNPQSH